MIWSKHGEVGENVPQETFDDEIMPNVAPHQETCVIREVAVTNEQKGVNMQPMATNDDVFRNTLADDTVEDDGLSHMLCDVEGRFLSAR
jgi:hypothetical protein